MVDDINRQQGTTKVPAAVFVNHGFNRLPQAEVGPFNRRTVHVCSSASPIAVKGPEKGRDFAGEKVWVVLCFEVGQTRIKEFLAVRQGCPRAAIFIDKNAIGALSVWQQCTNSVVPTKRAKTRGSSVCDDDIGAKGLGRLCFR